MAARFAELCRPLPLMLDGAEQIVSGIAFDEPSCLTCEEDIFLGFFFDGTNNNKYRDTPEYCHSNVARLYEAYPGKGTVSQLALTSGAAKADEPYLKGPGTDPYLYRKTYIPGVGTPFKKLGDSGEDRDKTGGLAAAMHAEVRMCWALLQVTNHISAALLGENLTDPLDNDGKLAQKMLDRWYGEQKPLPPTLKIQPYQTKPGQWLEIPNPQADFSRATVLAKRSQALHEKIKVRLANKPSLRRVRISVFGFSRGAAEARAFCNWLLNAYGGGVGGIALSIDFLGLFDTVASVGISRSAPGADGHYAWATEQNLSVSSSIKRCVHLVAAHEVRASFPLDSVGSGRHLKEVVYPGVHSDIGGGYLPDDQGRANGKGSEGDQKKISQITLAQMYREALMAGVPMTNPSEWKGFRESNFKIDSQTIKKFNDYVQATSKLSTPSSSPVSKASLAAIDPMWPVERQPSMPLLKLIHQHYGYFLQWRRSILGHAHEQASLNASTAVSKAQDIVDFKVTDQQFKLELDFLQDQSSFKYLNSDDPVIEKILRGTSVATSVFPGPIVSTGLSLLARHSVANVMKDKQKEWDEGIKALWLGHCPAPCLPFFETLMHDSRAWFKPLGAEAADETKVEIAKLQRENHELKQRNEALLTHPDLLQRSGVAVTEVQRLKEKNTAQIEENNKIIKEYKTGRRVRLIYAGQEPYRMYGYLRWRHIFAAAG
ncbi:T6SS phospholipase effector Tle1-like catalytic domain-containing protein [Iodobacter fluviatilis]|uniref:T6SS Phospholipase effector Tle1-like catalytic domain-containing protein n=1 Tax=Iodobacter fluviatilis TaxID=537 RepID=A0A7G3G6J3_9NEIS|nr:DUF2235 domain-containing protein [Iodobacter fluviatilis]QBC42927.1 hypothetical protein C1H71_04750 [Iodobacter fluviatilis]